MHIQPSLSPHRVALLVTLLSQSWQTDALNLNITALSASHGWSTLECWRMDMPFSISTQSGTVGSAVTQLGGAANVSYTVLPSSFDAGLHNAPGNQWVIFLSGLAYITLPKDNTTSAYVSGGQFGLIFASDTARVSTLGHRTQYPGVTETIVLQIPTEDGEIPIHNVLHTGPCSAEDVVGLLGLSTSSS